MSSTKARPRRLSHAVLYTLVFCLVLSCQTVTAWEWSDWILSPFVVGGSSSSTKQPTHKPLTLSEISELRVREIKHRLARHHGYSQEDLSRMLDKKELIHSLAYAEEQTRRKDEEEARRSFLIQSIVGTFVSIVAVFLWPLIAQAWEVAAVNLVVYKDRKVHEATRCMELKSPAAILGVVLMGILDSLQVWLSVSVFLSWFIRSKYFFPTPNFSIRPGQFMGQEIANSAAGNYGINMGSMAITWAMRFAHSKIELWTGKAMAAAHRRQTQMDKAQRKEAKRKAKAEAEEAKREAIENYRKEFLESMNNEETEFDSPD